MGNGPATFGASAGDWLCPGGRGFKSRRSPLGSRRSTASHETVNLRRRDTEEGTTRLCCAPGNALAMDTNALHGLIPLARTLGMRLENAAQGVVRLAGDWADGVWTSRGG